ncbi:MAG: SIMPL domain-containing protein [Planctomycetota bacterium]
MSKPTTLLAVLTLLVGLALPGFAAEQTITVNAVGEAKIKPDTLVLSGTITETNEKMKDAVTGFNSTRRRALAAVNELGIENLQVTTSSLSVGIAGAPAGGPFGGPVPDGQPATPGALQISQSVTLTVSGIDKMEEQAVIDLVVKLLEGTKEAGVDMSTMDAETMMMMQMGLGGAGGSSATVFKVSDPDAAMKAATKAAVEKARVDASYLAELAGGKLGPVVAITYGIAPVADDSSGMNPYMMIWGMMAGEDGVDPYSAKTTDEITVARALVVSFKLITE